MMKPMSDQEKYYAAKLAYDRYERRHSADNDNNSDDSTRRRSYLPSTGKYSRSNAAWPIWIGLLIVVLICKLASCS